MSISLHKTFCRQDRYAGRAATQRAAIDGLTAAEDLDLTGRSIIRRSEARRHYAVTCRRRQVGQYLKMLDDTAPMLGGDASEVALLEMQLTALLQQRQDYKDRNKAARRRCRSAVPGEVLSMLSSIIRRVEQQIAALSVPRGMSLDTLPHPIVGAGYTLAAEMDHNRLLFCFSRPPSRAARMILRHHGFTLQPSSQCWVRTCNAGACFAARRAAAALDQLTAN